MTEEISIYTGNMYEHDEYGEVKVMNLEKRAVGVTVLRNDVRTSESFDGVYTWYVTFRTHTNDKLQKCWQMKRWVKEQKLEDFQHAIHD